MLACVFTQMCFPGDGVEYTRKYNYKTVFQILNWLAAFFSAFIMIP